MAVKKVCVLCRPERPKLKGLQLGLLTTLTVESFLAWENWVEAEPRDREQRRSLRKQFSTELSSSAVCEWDTVLRPANATELATAYSVAQLAARL